FGALVREHKDELALLMSREMGKVLPEAGGDVQEAIDMSFYMAGEGRRLSGQTTPSELRDKFNMSVRMPIGVIGVITPWNFPIAIPSWKIAPALVCGNTVVFKPAKDTPALGERFVALLAEAGFAGGVVNVVHGGGGQAGGARPRAGGEDATGNRAENGCVYRPTIFGDVEPGMRIAQEEIFGPTTALIPVGSFEEAIQAANGVRFGLSSSIFTRDVNKA